MEDEDDEVICLDSREPKEVLTPGPTQGLIFYTFPHLFDQGCQENSDKVTSVSPESEEIEQCLENVESLARDNEVEAGLQPNNSLIFYTLPNPLNQNTFQILMNEDALGSNVTTASVEEPANPNPNDVTYEVGESNVIFYTFPNVLIEEKCASHLEESEAKRPKVDVVSLEEEKQEIDDSTFLISMPDPPEKQPDLKISNVVTLTKSSKRKASIKLKSGPISQVDTGATKLDIVEIVVELDNESNSQSEFDESIFEEIEKEIEKRSLQMPPISKEKMYRCLYCSERFTSTIEAKNHQIAIHQASWR